MSRYIYFVLFLVVSCTTTKVEKVPEVEHILLTEPINLNVEMVSRGEKVFKKQCSSCHGERGEGIVGQGARLNSPDFLGIADDEFISKTITNGRPETMMASYKNARKVKKEIPNLVAYIRSWQNDYKIFKKYKVDHNLKISGDIKAGRKSYEQFCLYCHGTRGEGYSYGGPGTGIGLTGFLSVASDDYIKKTIQIGRAGTAMKPFGHGRGLANMKDKEMNDIVAYLRSLE